MLGADHEVTRFLVARGARASPSSLAAAAAAGDVLAPHPQPLAQPRSPPAAVEELDGVD